MVTGMHRPPANPPAKHPEPSCGFYSHLANPLGNHVALVQHSVPNPSCHQHMYPLAAEGLVGDVPAGAHER